MCVRVCRGGVGKGGELAIALLSICSNCIFSWLPASGSYFGGFFPPPNPFCMFWIAKGLAKEAVDVPEWAWERASLDDADSLLRGAGEKSLKMYALRPRRWVGDGGGR